MRPRVICYSCGYRFYHSVTRIAMGKSVEGKNAARVTQQNLSDYYQKTNIFAVRSPVSPGLPLSILDLHSADIIVFPPRSYE
ncbi:hypothetical protein GXU17_002818 [Escherichia coli]|nr:hypothetical protein [Escherichia coli]EFI4246457.1 hypothetical protein [Escherichia coli]EFI5849024.1 hypothetical protein [Escherichia coli]EFI8298625.1 hypothetical protein [Escherichia coli]EFI9516872.1 hypothetical protein [Escherichia coli]